MARGFISLAMQAARAADRSARQRQRELVRLERAAERDTRNMEREEKRLYQEQRAAEIEVLNGEIDSALQALDAILATALVKPPGINWAALAEFRHTTFEPDAFLEAAPVPAIETMMPAPPGFFARLVPGRLPEHEEAVAQAKRDHAQLQREHRDIAQRRATALNRQQWAAVKQAKYLESLREGYGVADPQAVAEIFQLILEGSDLPDDFPRAARTAYTPESRQLVVDYQLPSVADIIPEYDRHRYNKSADKVTSTKRSTKSAHTLYAQAVAKTVLRCMHELFAADEAPVIDVVTFNALVDTVDPGTGKRIQPYLVSVRTTAQKFRELELAHVDALQCLKRMSASVSRSPAELAPVKPIVDINMADPRFIAETDVLSMLDQRPNLMELSSSEFESLITNLFQRMGLETKLTQASRDGGVDCVAFDLRPIVGGKVIIQAKRYKNTVGVSAVRDLFGTVHNEGASKGILVTTSGYGTASFEFAKGKPIELIEGGNLLYLLKEHAGLDAKIEMPEDWADPV